MLKYLTLYIIAFTFLSCSRENTDNGYINEADAKVFTLPEVINIDENSVLVGSKISGNNDMVTERGVYYSSSDGFVENGAAFKVVLDTSDASSFFVPIQGLEVNSTYYARAYIKVNGAEMFGSQIEFTTKEPEAIDIPTVLTDTITEIEPTSARIHGTVTSIGGSGIIERGICYSTTAVPAITDNRVPDVSTGLGKFSTRLTGLTNLEHYNARAYAINKKGVSYGEVKSFQARFMSKKPTTVFTSTDANITTDLTSAIISIKVTDNGGEVPSEYGVYYGTSATAIDTKFQELSNKIDAEGNVTVKVSGLTMNTQYFFKAYATNGTGTGLSETTLTCITDVMHDGIYYKALPPLKVKVNGVEQSLVFLDRNVGAKRVATSVQDKEAYGWLFQFGRRVDGHQIVNWLATGRGGDFNLPIAANNLAPSDRTTLNNSPVYGANDKGDWISPPFTDPATQDKYWGVSTNDPNVTNGGTNNPCPPGYRIPTAAELTGLQVLYGSAAALFDSPLKIPAAGYCNVKGSFAAVGTGAYLWASDLGTAAAVTTNKTAEFGGYALFTTGKAVRGIEKASALAIRPVRIY